MSNALFFYRYATPYGSMIITASDIGVTDIRFGKKPVESSTRVETELIKEAHRQLKEYFKGSLKEFTVPLDLIGTSFQKKVWNAIKAVPYGSLVSYKDIAQQVGHPRAFRAVGSANANNPIPIICACHRVINRDGGMGGYAYGLDMKESLIKLESDFL